jgi:hypothetical protein
MARSPAQTTSPGREVPAEMAAPIGVPVLVLRDSGREFWRVRVGEWEFAYVVRGVR